MPNFATGTTIPNLLSNPPLIYLPFENTNRGLSIVNKTVYVSSSFKPVGKEVKVKVLTGEKKKGFFGGDEEITRTEIQWEQTGYSDCEIDGNRFTNDIQEAILGLNSDGYVVTSITPIISGRYNYQYQANGTRIDNHCSGGGFSYGYGYSITEGVVIVGQKHS